jgi:heptosyltransferase-2
MAKESSKILVMRLSSLGDLILMIPMLRALRESSADRRVHLLCKARYAGLFEGNGFLDRLIPVEQGDLRDLMRLRRQLAREEYDAIIDAHNVIRSNLLFHSLPAKRKLQIAKSEMKKLLLIRGKINLYRQVISQADRYAVLAGSLGAPPRESFAELPIPPDAARRAAAALSEAGLGDGAVVALAPGARWQTKMWPKEYFGELIARIAQGGDRIVLIGGREDSALNAEIARAASPAPLDLTGKLSIMESAAVLKRCAALVTNDSAPLHLAEAVGTPVVAFFGPTVREFGYFPRLERSRSLEAELDCRPCSRNGARPCPYGTKECLTAINPQKAHEALLAVVGERRLQS